LDKKNINLEIIECGSYQEGFKTILKQKTFLFIGIKFMNQII
jgi:hypothetical protein